MYAWICRNKNGILLMYEYKPSRTEDDWFEPFGHYFVLTEEELPEGVNPRWEDEPVLIEIKLLVPQCGTIRDDGMIPFCKK